MTIIIDTADGIRAYHMLAQYHACKLELKGIGHSTGRSIIAHVKRTYGLRGNKEAVVNQFEQMLRAHGVLK